MGGVLPCGPDPRDAVTPFEGKEPGCSSAAVDQCHQQTSVALKIKRCPDESWRLLWRWVCLKGGHLTSFFWLAGGQLLLQTI